MLTVQQLAALLAGEVRGRPDRSIGDAHSIDKAGPGEITFAGDEANLRKLTRCRAGAVIVGRRHLDDLPVLPAEATLIVVEDAPAAFMQVMAALRPQRERPEVGIAPGAHVSPSAQIGPRTNVHPGACIADDVTIGEQCDIHAGVAIGPGCRIGHRVTLFPNVVLYADTAIGDRVRIHAGAVIGADGFGYRLVDGRHVKIAHYGRVRIGDDVEIGASTTIDRGMIGETIIGEGTKIDNQVMIAHNCELGRHNLIVSQVGFAGSSTTGDHVVCAGQVGVSDHVHLGEGCVLGSRSAVNKDVPAGARYIGMPALPVTEAMKHAMALKKVPEMRKALRKVESQVGRLCARLDALTGTGETAAKPAA